MFLAVLIFAAQLPKIDVMYPPFGSIYDRTCGNAKAEDIAAAEKLRPSLQAEWDKEGPQYLSVVMKEIGLPFPYGEMQATLTVCSTGTMSSPLFINVRQYLADAAHAAPPGDFSEKLFHELMHHYVAPVRASSALRKKYASEPPVVLAHLHVMALEKFVLTKLGKKTELDFLDQEYRTENGNYKRAWEIVNDIEGYDAFVRELKAAGRANRVSR